MLTYSAVGMVSKPDAVDAANAPLDVGVDTTNRRRQTVSAALEPRLFRHHVGISASDHCQQQQPRSRSINTLCLRKKTWCGTFYDNFINC